MKATTKRFSLGKTLITPAALEAIKEANQHPITLLSRHQSLDQGVLEGDDHQENVDALNNGERIFSAFVTKTDIRVWVITEADRSLTTILLPDDY